MAVKALNKTDCEWWSNKVDVAYNSFKSRVKATFPIMDIDEKEREAHYREMAMKAINEREFVYNGSESREVNIYSYGKYLSVRFDIEYDAEHPQYVDEKREKFMEDRCHKIREICEPYAKQRDELLVIIHSRPTTEDLAGIVKWCNEVDKLYAEQKECEL